MIQYGEIPPGHARRRWSEGLSSRGTGVPAGVPIVMGVMHIPIWSRRDLVRALGRVAGGVLAAPLSGACAGLVPERLAVVTTPVRETRAAAGLQALGTGGERDGVLYIPPVHEPDGERPAPLLLMLHGAGGSGRRAARLLAPFAEQAGCVILAPDSRGSTWDAVTSKFGPDVRFIERALSTTLGRCSIESSRIAAAGFSDGATYALGLGRANGRLFSHVLAFSPGFLVPAHLVGSPRIYVSHGLARSERRDPSDRLVQPGPRAAAPPGRIRRPISGVRRPARTPAPGGAPGDRVVSGCVRGGYERGFSIA